MKETGENPGEDTSNWALYQPGFRGTVRQLTCCGKCGQPLAGGRHTKRKVTNIFKPSMHFLCDECFNSLPD